MYIISWMHIYIHFGNDIMNVFSYKVFSIELPSKDTHNSFRSSGAYIHQQINHHWFRQWLVAWTAPSHYLNQCRNIVNLTQRNKLQWNFYRYSYILIEENPFQNVVWKMAAILPWPQCVNSPKKHHTGSISISKETSYCKVLQSLKAMRFLFKIVLSVWNLTGTLAALLPRYQSNLKLM